MDLDAFDDERVESVEDFIRRENALYKPENDGINYINDMPLNIIDNIFDYLSSEDIFNMQYVSRALRDYSIPYCRKHKFKRDVMIIEDEYNMIPYESLMSVVMPELRYFEPFLYVCPMEGEIQTRWMSPEQLYYESSIILRNLTHPAEFFENVIKFSVWDIALDDVIHYIRLMPKLEELTIVKVPMTEEKFYELVDSIQLNDQDHFLLSIDASVEYSNRLTDHYLEKTSNLLTRCIKLTDDDRSVAVRKVESYERYFNSQIEERPKREGEMSCMSFGCVNTEHYGFFRQMSKRHYPDDSWRWD